MKRTLLPKTKLGRITLWSGGLSVLLIALSLLTGSSDESKLSDWATFFTLIFAFGASWLSFRWAWRHVMWRLRYRLIVTYIFVGVVPVFLIVLLVAIGSYIIFGQVADYLILVDGVDYQLVEKLVFAGVELDGLVQPLVLFLYFLIVGFDQQSVLRVLGVRLLQGQADA